jgi:ABC-type lipoprotein export system ATPase subunit
VATEAAVVRHVSRRYPAAGTPVVALDDVSVVIESGQMTVIAGPSGSGKSTLLGLLACLDRPDSGVVELDGRPIHAASSRERRRFRRRSIGIVLPLPPDNLLERLDAAGNLVWAANVRAGNVQSGGRLTPADVEAHLAAVGLGDAGTKRIRQLSGGEQLRLALACAMVGDPPLVVADEPTASLDRSNAATMVDAMRSAANRGATLVVASHDTHILDEADVIVRLDHGRRVS